MSASFFLHCFSGWRPLGPSLICQDIWGFSVTVWLPACMVGAFMSNILWRLSGTVNLNSLDDLITGIYFPRMQSIDLVQNLHDGISNISVVSSSNVVCRCRHDFQKPQPAVYGSQLVSLFFPRQAAHARGLNCETQAELQVFVAELQTCNQMISGIAITMNGERLVSLTWPLIHHFF